MKLRLLLITSLLLISQIQAHGQTSETVKIGMLLPLSGSYASGGIDTQRGVEAAIAALGSASRLQVIFSDSRGDALTGISEFRKLTESENTLAVYAFRGLVAMPLKPISLNRGVPLLGGAGNKDFTTDSKFAFQIWTRSDDEGIFLARVFKTRNFQRIALVTVQDDWQSSVSDGLRSELKNLRLTTVFDQEVVPAEMDFRSLLLKLKARSPEVIFANLAVNQIATFLRQARDLGISSKVYSSFWVSKNDVIESAGLETIEGVRFVEMDTDRPTLRKFLAEKYSALPTGATLSAYTATLLLQQAASSNPNIKTTHDLYNALLGQSEISTPDGTIPIVNRSVKFILKEKAIRKGKVELAEND